MREAQDIANGGRSPKGDLPLLSGGNCYILYVFSILSPSLTKPIGIMAIGRRILMGGVGYKDNYKGGIMQKKNRKTSNSPCPKQHKIYRISNS